MRRAERRGKRGSEADALSRISRFESRIKEHENRTYGFALIFESLSMLYAHDDALLDDYRRRHMSMIQQGRDTLFRALSLLEQVRESPSESKELEDFEFVPFENPDDADGVRWRCEAMVAAYERIFPERERETPFTSDEALRLLDEASAVQESAG